MKASQYSRTDLSQIYLEWLHLELTKIQLFAGYDYEYKKLEFVQKLGEGNFAVVHLAKGYDICGNMGKSMVAVKELKGSS